jgi:hypothetical protein
MKLSSLEHYALATCDENDESQRIVSAIIEKETQRIRGEWTETERRRRAGLGDIPPWLPPLCHDPGELIEE